MNEFENGITEQLGLYSLGEEEIKKLFDFFDANEDGTITSEEFRKGYKLLCRPRRDHESRVCKHQAVEEDEQSTTDEDEEPGIIGARHRLEKLKQCQSFTERVIFLRQAHKAYGVDQRKAENHGVAKRRRKPCRQIRSAPNRISIDRTKPALVKALFDEHVTVNNQPRSTFAAIIRAKKISKKISKKAKERTKKKRKKKKKKNIKVSVLDYLARGASTNSMRQEL